MSALAGPEPPSDQPAAAAGGATWWPSAAPRSRSRPGDDRPSLARTRRIGRRPAAAAARRRTSATGRSSRCAIFHGNSVFMLGPEANHHILVSHADNFRWREGHFGDLMPLLGDGLLTIDGEFHRRSRRIMLPAFHRERIAAIVETMRRGDRPGARALAAAARRSTSTTGPASSRCASRCARCSASTPTRRRGSLDAAQRVRGGARSTRATTSLQILRGPGHAVRADARARRAARRALIYARSRAAARDRRARRGHPLAAARRAATRTAARSRTARSATRS